MSPRDRQVHRLVQAAAAPTLQRIRDDHNRASAQVRSLLAYLEGHLFDHDLDGNGLKKACGVHDHTIPMAFHQTVGLPPYGYIEDCRMEVACRLLVDTDLKVWQIAHGIGYSTLQVFSRAFNRLKGVRPSVYRRQASQPSEAGDTQVPLLQPEAVTKALEGRLARHEADELARRLSDLYPESFQLPQPSSLSCNTGRSGL